MQQPKAVFVVVVVGCLLVACGMATVTTPTPSGAATAPSTSTTAQVDSSDQATVGPASSAQPVRTDASPGTPDDAQRDATLDQVNGAPTPIGTDAPSTAAPGPGSETTP